MKHFRSIAVALIACFVLISCGGVGSTNTGYLNTNNTSVNFVEWTENNQQLNGTIHEVEVVNSQPPKTTSFTIPFGGTHNGNQIFISGSFFGFSWSVTGELDNNTLTLQIPTSDGHLMEQAFNAASVDDYNKAVDQLQAAVQQQDQVYYNQEATASAAQATASARASEQQAVTNDNQQLGNALSQLAPDANALASFSFSDTLVSSLIKSYLSICLKSHNVILLPVL